jgi:hypothetical protein
VSQSSDRPLPEARSREALPLRDETAGQPNDDIVELLVRVPIEALGDQPTGEPGADVAAAAARGATAGSDRPSAVVTGGGSEPGDGFLELVVSAEAEIKQEAVSARPAAVRSGGKAAVHHSEQIRFARLHLRTGSLLQARSEFEALAACDLLDVPATLDLAEVRWRTGDLMGAGSAAAAYLAARGEEALGFLIAAEAAAADDRVIEARQHAGRALERSVSNLEVFFAGVPRRMSWPESSWTAPVAIKIDAPAPQAPALDWPAKMATPVVAETPVEASAGSLWARPEEVVHAVEPEVPEAVAPEAVALEPEAAPVEPAVAPEAVAPEAVEAGEPVAPEAVAAVPEAAPVEPAVAPEAVALEPEAAPVEPAVAPEAVALEPEAAPVEPAVAPEAVAPEAVEPEAPVAATAVQEPEPEPAPDLAPESPAPAAANPWDGEIHAGAEALASGDALMAALHFAVALRMSPESAQAVLDGIGERGDLALELVRGDALSLLGNESDAGQAYASVASKLSMSKPAAAPEPAPKPAAPEPAPEPATRADTDEQPRSIKWE